MQAVQAQCRMLRISPHKLNDVAKIIRGKPVHHALMELKGCKKRIAKDVSKAVQSALSNGENNAGLDGSTLYVQEASVGKDRVSLKRMDFKGRSRAGRIVKYFSRIRIVLGQTPA